MSNISITRQISIGKSSTSESRRCPGPRRAMAVVQEDDERKTMEKTLSSSCQATRFERRGSSLRLQPGRGPCVGVRFSTNETAPDEGNTETKLKPVRVGWKSSKLFSRTLSSAEFLRSLKRLSVTSSADESKSSQPVTTKSLRYKIRSFQKKNSGCEEGVAGSDERVEIGSIKPSTSNIDHHSEDKTCQEKWRQKKGIICKTEDLMFIMSDVNKNEEEISKPLTKQMPRRFTRSNTLNPSTDKSLNLRREGSLIRPASHRGTRPRLQRTSYRRTCSDEAEKGKGSTEICKKKSTDKTYVKNDNVKEIKETSPADNDKESGDEGTVSWDDKNLLDAMMLGDAIESFLKSSMGPGREKRVSFENVE
ncbi:uncharacterized protein LOC143236014 [Tachypleus tridentatus]|uniref:uncharacterized protein LOC143236014 n=1 Tax=Tachypleus tridentatus TaxID=6853 RepID=UPI003FD1CB17